jgi:hypothetical protein
MKNKLEIFKATFCSVTTSIYIGLLIYSFFDIDFSNSKSLIDLLVKSLSTSVSTGLVFGVLNAAFGNTLVKQKWLIQRMNGVLTNIF